MAYVLAADPKPHHRFTFLVYLFATISIASGVFTIVIIYFGDPVLFGCSFNGCLTPSPFDYHTLGIGDLTVGMIAGGRYLNNFEFLLPRYSGITSNPNSVGLFSSLALIGLIAITKAQWSIKALGPLFLIIATLCVLIFSGSRAAYLMTLVGLSMVLALRSERSHLGYALISLVLISPFLLYGISFTSGWPSNVDTQEVLWIGERGSIWMTSIYAAKETWTTGMGFGLVQELLLKLEGHNSGAHSVPLSLLVETGVLGLLLYIITCFRPIFKIIAGNMPVTRSTAGIISLLTALFVHQLFDSSVLRYHWLHFVFSALLGLALSIGIRKTFSPINGQSQK